jgi:hypothetical protein
MNPFFVIFANVPGMLAKTLDFGHIWGNVIFCPLDCQSTSSFLFGLVFFANKGDRLIKTPYSKYAYLVTQYGDSSRYRIFSKTCDSELGDQFK